MGTKVWYACLDHCEESRYELELDSPHWCLSRPIEQADAARACAKDYYSKHDGWESSWPMVFALYETEEGPELARFRVAMEVQPHFYAYTEKAP